MYMLIRIFTPEPLGDLSNGAGNAIFAQTQSLRGLAAKYAPNSRLEVVSWLDISKKEPIGNRFLRIAVSFFTSNSSAESYYYPNNAAVLSLNDPGEPGIDFFHYSFSYSWLSKVQPFPGRKRVVILHNLESILFALREKSTKNPFKKIVHFINRVKLQKHELKLNKYSDELWFFSAIEQALHLQVGENKCKFVPPVIPKLPISKPDIKGKRLGMIGNWEYLPNFLSLVWFLDNVWPECKELGYSLNVAGKGIESRLRIFFPEINWLGFVVDPDDYWDHIDVNLVPHLEGAGVRIKLVEGIGRGVFSVSHSAALDAFMPGLNFPSIRAANTPTEWVEALTKLWCHSVEDAKILTLKNERILNENFKRLLDDLSS